MGEIYTPAELSQRYEEQIAAAMPAAREMARYGLNPLPEGSWTKRREILRLKWGWGNSKYAASGTIPVGIAPLLRCKYPGACAAYCLARQSKWRSADTVKNRAWNTALVDAALEISPARLATIIATDLAWIRAHRPEFTVVRINDSGDFFSADYARAWFLAARNCPDWAFYAYTKSAPILGALKTRKPRNLAIWRSVGANAACRKYAPKGWLAKTPLTPILDETKKRENAQAGHERAQWLKDHPGAVKLSSAAVEAEMARASARGEKHDLYLRSGWGAGTVLALFLIAIGVSRLRGAAAPQA